MRSVTIARALYWAFTEISKAPLPACLDVWDKCISHVVESRHADVEDDGTLGGIQAHKTNVMVAMIYTENEILAGGKEQARIVGPGWLVPFIIGINAGK